MNAFHSLVVLYVHIKGVSENELYQTVAMSRLISHSLVVLCNERVRLHSNEVTPQLQGLRTNCYDHTNGSTSSVHSM